MMKTLTLLIYLSFSFVGDGGCNSSAQNKREQPGQQVGNAEIVFLKMVCSDDHKCVVIAFCDPALFTKENMTRIAKKVSERFEKRAVVNISIFDNKSLAEGYADGVGNLAEIQRDRRAWYLRTAQKEFLLFLPDTEKPDNYVSINLRALKQK
jgi:hypothetical protein